MKLNLVMMMKKKLMTHAFTKFTLTFLKFTLLLVFLAGCGSKRVIVNDLDERESNEILVFLSNKGINVQKVPAPTSGGSSNKVPLFNITVDDNQANEAMALLNQVGLPRRRGQNLLSIFANVGLVPSGMQDKIRYQAGLAEQIASTIRKIDGVLDTDVQISYPEEDPLNPMAPKGKITASVYVKHNGVLDDPNAHLQTRIKRLVAGSINGLDYDNVTVIGDKARYGDPSGAFMTSIGDEDRQYVNVWSIILAKDSVTTFRIIFFSFSIAILLLLLTLCGLVWKLLPVIKAVKEKGELTNLKQIQASDLQTNVAASETAKKENEDEDDDDDDDDEPMNKKP